MVAVNPDLYIEKDIPVTGRGFGGLAYGVDWRTLEIGDSVFLPGYRQGQPVEGMRNLNITAIKSAVKEYGFVARAATKDDENGVPVPGVRVWRIA